jgi:hypothetical protein
MNGAIGKLTLAVAAFAMTACAASTGLPPDAVVVTPLTLEPPPIYSLLGYRADLELTSEQIAALDSIGQAVRDENRELIEELRRSSAERRNMGGALVVSEEGRPVLEAIRENQREAVNAVSRLLDETQRDRVCELSNRDNARNRPEASARQARSRRGAPNLEGDALQRPIGWNWCQTPGEEDVA